MEPCELFLESRARKIVAQDGMEVTLDDAKRLWDAGMVRNYNLALQRLATRAGWDFDELDRQYAAMDKARCK